MRVQLQVERSFILTLNEEEAFVVRNTLEHEHPDWRGDEPPRHTEIREHLHQSLNSLLEDKED